MAKMKDLVMDIITLYRDGYTVIAIARQLKLSITEVNEVVCNYITPITKE